MALDGIDGKPNNSQDDEKDDYDYGNGNVLLDHIGRLQDVVGGE